MMKKRGFTIAEILMTMAILGFVVALSVPMLGQQKMKKPNTTLLGHGLFECYYDNAGLLTQHYIDEKGTDTVTHVNGSCKFTPPVANYYAITSIGAGGSGGLMNGTPSYRIVYPLPTNTTYVSTGSDFQSSLQSLSGSFSWALDKWNLAAPDNLVNYSLQGSVGNGGASDRVLKIWSNYMYNTCKSCITTGTTGCPNDCYNVSTCCGGDSIGYSLYIHDVQLNKDTQVSYTIDKTGTILSINGKKAIVYPAPAGGDGKTEEVNNSYQRCIQGTNSVAKSPSVDSGFCKGCKYKTYKVTRKGAKKTTGYPNYEPKDGESGVKASISSSPSRIKVSYEYLKITTRYGTHGEFGNVITRTYEKLPTTPMTIKLANKSDEDTVVYILNSKNEKKYLSKTSAGENGKEVYDDTTQYTISSGDDLPLPAQLKRQVQSQAQNTLTSSEHSKKSYIADLVVAPGSPGIGAYPFLTSINATTRRYIGNWSYPTSATDFSTDENYCLNGDKPSGSGNSKYCKATYGGKGAVIIEW